MVTDTPIPAVTAAAPDLMPPTVTTRSTPLTATVTATVLADLDRMEGKLKDAVVHLWASYGLSLVALVVALIALLRTYR